MGKTLGRTFYFEKSLWAKLDEDAARCKRSSTKQLEAILTAYYGVGDVGLNNDALEVLGKADTRTKLKRPLLHLGEKKEKPKKKKVA